MGVGDDPGGSGDERELQTRREVARGVDAGHARLALVVDLEQPVVAPLDAPDVAVPDLRRRVDEDLLAPSGEQVRRLLRVAAQAAVRNLQLLIALVLPVDPTTERR